MSKPDRLFEVKPDDDFGARWSGQRSLVGEVSLQVVWQDVEEREWVAHDYAGVGLGDVYQC